MRSWFENTSIPFGKYVMVVSVHMRSWRHRRRNNRIQGCIVRGRCYKKKRGICRVRGEFKELDTSLQGRHGELKIEGKGKKLQESLWEQLETHSS
jgi:hypothetical protein